MYTYVFNQHLRKIYALLTGFWWLWYVDIEIQAAVLLDVSTDM